MAYKTDETVYVETGNGTTLELGLYVNWQAAEPDVGIMGDYLDEWEVVAVNGSTKHAKWVDGIVSRNDGLRQFIDEAIYDNQ